MFLLFRHMRSDSELKAEIHQSRVCIMASAPRALNLVITENNFKPIKHETHHGRTVKVLIMKGNILINYLKVIIISNRTCPKWNCNVRDWKPNENKFLDNHTLVLFWCYSTGLYINEIIVCLFILLRQANLSAFQNTNTYYLVQRVLCQPIYVSNILRIWSFANAYTLALQYFFISNTQIS